MIFLGVGSFNVCAGTLKVFQVINCVDKHLYLMIGPASAIPLNTQNVAELINYYIPKGMVTEFLGMIMSSPHTSYHKLQHIAVLAKYLYTGQITDEDILSAESIGSYFISQENLYSLRQMEQVSLKILPETILLICNTPHKAILR